MPKVRRRRVKIRVEKTWSCPECGEELKTVFSGEMVQFYHGGREIANAGGTYESVAIICPKCQSEIVFTRKELEEE